MYIFGGYSQDAVTGQQQYFNDVWSVNLKTKEIKKLICTASDAHFISRVFFSALNVDLSGQIPSARADHSAVIKDTYMYVFGGIATSWTTSCSNDLFELNLTTLQWRKMPAFGAVPQHRQQHSCVAYKDSLFVFGGRNNSMMFNDICEYNLHLGRWHQILVSGPSPRIGHTACVLGDRMVIYGGQDKPFSLCGDLWAWDFVLKKWYKGNIGGNVPPARVFHSAVVHDSSMIIFGGLNCDDMFEFVFGNNYKIPVLQVAPVVDVVQMNQQIQKQTNPVLQQNNQQNQQQQIQLPVKASAPPLNEIHYPIKEIEEFAKNVPDASLEEVLDSDQKETTPYDNQQFKDEDLCVICMENRINCVILRCGHLAICTNCGKSLTKCPICQQNISEIVQTFHVNK